MFSFQKEYSGPVPQIVCWAYCGVLVVAVPRKYMGIDAYLTHPPKARDNAVREWLAEMY